MISAMEWSGKIVAAMLAGFLVIGGPVVLGVLRLAGTVSWPPLWAVFALFGVLLVPLALVALWASNDDGYSDDGGGFWGFITRWSPFDGY
jgi:hypothetical protein